MEWIYLDNNATTQPAPQVCDAVGQMHEQFWANPSSVHRFGQLVRQRVELARAAVARLIGARDHELIFTSGGTESNNLALRGAVTGALQKHARRNRAVIITSRVEHGAICEPAEDLQKRGVELIYLPVDTNGCVDPQDLASALAEHAREDTSVLFSCQWANNETGVVLPIERLAAVCRHHRQIQVGSSVLFHSDATQAVGKIPVDVKQSGLDLMTMSAHKFHGPKGVGALYVRSGVRLAPQNIGGPQERQRRGGTENAASIVGMGAAADLATAFVQDGPRIERFTALRDRFELGVKTTVPNVTIIGGTAAQRLWNTSNLGFASLEAEAILLGLSEKGVCASAGAACSSGSLEPSPVLLAMGIPEPVAHGSVRFSISRDTSDAQIDLALAIVPKVIERLAATLPLG